MIRISLVTAVSRLCCVVIFWVIIPIEVAAQQYNFRTYSLEEGLAQSQVPAICQDARGNMWFGTYGAGICLFNGAEFRYITTANGLPSNSIWDIVEDSQQNIWIATNEGLSRYDGLQFTNFTSKDGLPGDKIYKLIEDNNRNIIIGTEATGISVFDGNSFLNFSKKDGLVSNEVTALFKDADGKIWIGTNNGISIYHERKFSNLTINDGLSDNHINGIFQDGKSRMWLCTEKGITIINGEGRTYITTKEGLPADNITSIFPDRNGHVWVTTEIAGACRLQPKEDGSYAVKKFSDKEGLSTNNLYTGLQDRQGCIWFATNGGGVCKYAGESFMHITEKQGLSNRMVMAVLEDSDGNIWMGTDGGGLNKFDGNNMTIYRVTDGLPDDRINDLMQDENGHIWIATDKGIARYDGKRFHRYGKKDGNAPGMSTQVYKDSKGILWAAGDEGVAQVTEKGIIYPEMDEKLKKLVWDIAEDGKGNMWFATDFGVICYDRNEYRLLGKEEGLPTMVTISLTASLDGSIWAGTENGLCYFNGSKFISFTKEDGLTSGNIYLLAEDNQGHLIIGTEKGIDKIVFTKNKKIKEIKHYGYLNGFTGIECNASAVCKASGGGLWFGTIKGATHFNPGLEMADTTEPQTHITGLTLFYEQPDWAAWSDGIKPWSGLPQNLVLPHRKNHLTFDFIGISFFAPERVRYQFMLESFDEHWSPLTAKSQVTYSNLPPGEYMFLVRACNDAGKWNKTPASFGFVISKPFWMTAWFITPCILAIIGLVMALSSLRTKALRRSRQILEKKVAERTEELEEQKSSLERLSMVVSKSDNIVLILDHEGNLEWLNNSFERINGLDKEDIISKYGKNIRKFSNNPRISEILEECERTGQPVKYEAQNRKKTAQPIWESSTITPIYDDKGTLKNFIIIDADITESKRQEELIRQKNMELENLSIVASETGQGVLIANNKGSIEWMNQGFTKLTGYSFEEFTKKFGSTIPEISSFEGIDYIIKQLQTSQDSVTYDSMHERKSGESVWTSCTITPIHENGKLKKIVSIYSDITERKMAEQAIRAQKAELEQVNKNLEELSMVASKIDNGVIITDKDGKVIWTNDGFTRITGYSLGEIMGHAPDEILRGDDSNEETISEIKRKRAAKQHYNIEVLFYNKANDPVWIEVDSTPVLDKEGSLLKRIAIISDITERKKAREELIEKNKNITESIYYAKNIQQAVLPSRQVLYETFPDSFIFYQPKDIVSGDFYWFHRINDIFVICAADCTGHGVPGAFMSMIGNEFLHQIVTEKDITGPHQALDELDKRIKRALHQTGEEKEAKDGMDIAMCAVHLNTMWLQYSGAHRPVLIIRDGEIIELKPAKISIGGFDRKGKKFMDETMTLQNGDALYLFSDGFTDQFGGRKGKKFLLKKFKALLLEINRLPMAEQKTIFSETFNRWKGDRQQVDDVLVMGVRI